MWTSECPVNDFILLPRAVQRGKKQMPVFI